MSIRIYLTRKRARGLIEPANLNSKERAPYATRSRGALYGAILQRRTHRQPSSRHPTQRRQFPGTPNFRPRDKKGRFMSKKALSSTHDQSRLTSEPPQPSSGRHSEAREATSINPATSASRSVVAISRGSFSRTTVIFTVANEDPATSVQSPYRLPSEDPFLVNEYESTAGHNNFDDTKSGISWETLHRLVARERALSANLDAISASRDILQELAAHNLETVTHKDIMRGLEEKKTLARKDTFVQVRNLRLTSATEIHSIDDNNIATQVSINKKTEMEMLEDALSFKLAGFDRQIKTLHGGPYSRIIIRGAPLFTHAWQMMEQANLKARTGVRAGISSLLAELVRTDHGREEGTPPSQQVSASSTTAESSQPDSPA